MRASWGGSTKGPQAGSYPLTEQQTETYSPTVVKVRRPRRSCGRGRSHLGPLSWACGRVPSLCPRAVIPLRRESLSSPPVLTRTAVTRGWGLTVNLG